MSSINRRAFVIQRSGNFFTGKTVAGKPEFSEKLADAQGYSTIGVAKHFEACVSVMMGGGINVIRELSLGVVCDV